MHIISQKKFTKVMLDTQQKLIYKFLLKCVQCKITRLSASKYGQFDQFKAVTFCYI